MNWNCTKTSHKFYLLYSNFQPKFSHILILIWEQNIFVFFFLFFFQYLSDNYKIKIYKKLKMLKSPLMLNFEYEFSTLNKNQQKLKSPSQKSLCFTTPSIKKLWRMEEWWETGRWMNEREDRHVDIKSLSLVLPLVLQEECGQKFYGVWWSEKNKKIYIYI